jgi:hypothetical protein
MLLATLSTFNGEHLKPPAAPHEQCVELREFRGGGRGGCRVAVDRSLAWMCFEEKGEGPGKDPSGYDVRFRNADGDLVKEFSYDKRRADNWEGHVEIFYTSPDRKKNPDLKIGLAPEKDGTVVVAKARHCIPAESAKTIKR